MRKLAVFISIQLAAVFICSHLRAEVPPVAVVADALRSAGLPVLDVTQADGKITFRLKKGATAVQKTQANQIAASVDVSPAACAAWETFKKKAAFDKSMSDAGYDPTKFPRKP